jgi:large repetitive protein
LPTATTLTESGHLPAGITFTPGSNGTATIHGTPAAGTGGSFTVTIAATNPAAIKTSQTFILNVDQAPSITSTAIATCVVGSSNSFTFTTKGFPAATLTEDGALPSGVTFIDNGDGTATLSESPAASSATTTAYSFIVSAANGISPAATQTFKLSVDLPPTITSADNTTFTAGQSASFPVTTDEGVPATTTLRETGALPAGVTFTANKNGTGSLHGKPAVNAGGVYVFTISASNASSSMTTQSFTLTVNGSPRISSAASTTFTVDQTNSFTVSTKGFPLAALTESGTLPPDVTFIDNGNGTATISGMPTASAASLVAYSFTITANNGIGSNAAQTFRLKVAIAPVISSAASTTFTASKAGTFTVTTSSGLPTATTLTKGGHLPGGVSFTANPNGTATIHGTPAAGTGGIYDLSLTASNAAGAKSTQTFTLTVNQSPSITSAATATFVVGQAGVFTVTTKGFPAAALEVSSGSLPSGIGLVDNGNGTGTLSGVMLAGTGGSYTFTISAINSVATVSQNFTLIVDQPPVFTSASSAIFLFGESNSFTIATSGYPAPAIKETGPLPGGVKFVDGSNGTATLRGKPTSKGTYIITFFVSDGLLPDAVQTFELTVS